MITFKIQDSFSRFQFLMILAGLLLVCQSVQARVVISEIHYYPDENSPTLEFIELANPSTTPVDLSGFSFVNGIEFTFPHGTILSGGEYLVVASDRASIEDRYGITNVIGNFAGRLDNSGERLTLVNVSGVVEQTLRYRDEGKWPTAPDGSGHSLVLIDLNSDNSEPENWTTSPQLGGSPGAMNITPPGELEETIIIPEGATWRYKKGTGPFSETAIPWTSAEFDDSDWSVGESGFGYGDGDDNTTLTDMRFSYSTVACRKEFNLSASDLASSELSFGIAYDDGFSAFINGHLIANENTEDEVDHESLATAGHEASSGVEWYTIDPGHLVEGENVLAVLGANVTIDSTDFSLIPQLRILRQPQSGDAPLVFNELHRDPDGDSWVEIFNPRSTTVPLGGMTLTRGPSLDGAYEIPGGTSIPSNGFIRFTESETGLVLNDIGVRLFLRNSEGIVLAATEYDQDLPEAFGVREYSEVQFPDGSNSRWLTLTATPDAPNEVEIEDRIVINEIFYNPPEDREGEFVELYNRGEEAVDLSGFRFNRGITFLIPDGTILNSGEYLVISDDPDLTQDVYGLTGVLGPFIGGLSNRGENLRLVDLLGNIIDQVRYFEGGSWPEWADGGGASLELIDPHQNNDHGSAWQDSDESDKAPWERISYDVSSYRTSSESELHLFLADRGMCLIDDVSVRRNGGSNHIQNPGFETSTSSWLIQGTHHESRRVTYDSRSGNACLEFVASGKGDSSVNRIEIETSPRLSAGPYEVALWARWMRGASLIIGHGQFTAGPWGGRPGPSVNMSGNTLGGRLRLTVPQNLGTPGEENTARAHLRSESGSDNSGPVLWDMLHSPSTPSDDDNARLTIRAEDSDGIDEVTVFYREGHPQGAFSELPLSQVSGSHLYQGTLPQFSNGDKVVWYVEAVDNDGNTSVWPREAPDKTFIFQVRSSSSSSRDTVAIILDDRQTSELTSRPLHSNDLVDGAVIFNQERPRYGVGVRYRGSPWGRTERRNYRVRFEDDNPLFPDLKSINLSGRADGQAEVASFHVLGQNGTFNETVAVPLIEFVTTRVNGSTVGVQRLIQPYNNQFVRKWFPDTDGPMLKAVARLQFSDSGSRTGYDGASFDYMGQEPENYRYYYYQVLDRSKDDWSGFMELMRVMDPGTTSNSVHDATINDILDVEAFMRTMVPRVFVSDWDTLGIGQGHNAYLIEELDGRWETIGFDFNQAMPGNQVNFPVFPTFDPGWARLISRPATRRVYVNLMGEFLDGPWSTSSAAPFLDALQSEVGISMNNVRSFMSSRANVIRNSINAFRNVNFRISTNSGNDFTVDEITVDLGGDAPTTFAELVYSINGGETLPLNPRWSTPTRWTVEIPLTAPINTIDIFGVDHDGNVLSGRSIEVTSTVITSEGFIRGDADGDGDINIGDAVLNLLHQFRGVAVECQDALDTDDSGTLELGDALGLLNHIYFAADPPVAPYPHFGFDGTEDDLICDEE